MNDDKSKQNIILAQFIGGALVEDKEYPGEFRWWFDNRGQPITKTAPSFDTDWNWLMKVWQKIAELDLEFLVVDEMRISEKSCFIKALPVPYKQASSFISYYEVGDNSNLDLHSAVYSATYDFVEYAMLSTINHLSSDAQKRKK